MWTEEHRRIYRREGSGYPSDLRAGTAEPRGVAGWATAQDRHARGDERHLLLLRTGWPWRYLPRDSFPPRSTVYNIFRRFQRDGVWEAIWAELHMALRERMGREASPSAAVLDSQSVKSAYGDRQADRRHEGLRRPAAPPGCRAHFLLVRTQPASRQGLRKPYRHPGHLRSLASIQLALRRLARA
jgi:transposase